jgi:hypothetical protein
VLFYFPKCEKAKVRQQGKVMCESINVENKKQNHQKPPLSVIRIAGEILAGAAAGLAVALPALFAISNADSFQGCFGGIFVLWICFLFFPILYVLACAVGVYLLGNRGKQTGSFLLTLGSGFIGGLVMIVVSFILPVGWRGEATVSAILLLSFVLLIPIIFATYGFNLRRRYK